MDGFSKIPGFIAPTIRERLARGQSIDSVAILPALFLAYLQRWYQGKLPYEYQDQAMDPTVAHQVCSSTDPVLAMASESVLWGDIAGHASLVEALRKASRRVDNFQTIL
jgi:D-arabinitol 4-dehydrogenase